MNFFRAMSGQIYNYVTGFLPWSYSDTGTNSTIDVIKTTTGLTVITTSTLIDGREGYHEIKVNIPQAEIERLMGK